LVQLTKPEKGARRIASEIADDLRSVLEKLEEMLGDLELT